MSQPLQILHVIAQLDGYGMSGRLRLLLDHQLRAGHQPQVLALAAARQVLKAWQEQGLVCNTLDRRWRLDPFVAWRLARLLRQQPYDLLHAWDGEALNYVNAVRPAKVPPVISPAVAPGILPQPPARSSREEFLCEQSLPANAQLIALAGRLTRDKHIDEAIWSFELVRTISEDAHLLILGDGPDRPRLERFARLASESSALRFLGYRTDLRALLPHVDVFWQTGGSMLAALEAMAAQIPLVATDTPASRAVIRPAETGYYVARNDRAAWARSTIKLLQDKDLARSIGREAAQQVAAEFPSAAMVEKYGALYDGVLKSAATQILSPAN